MSPNEDSMDDGQRMRRIKRTSRVFQSVFLIYFGMVPLFLLVGHVGGFPKLDAWKSVSFLVGMIPLALRGFTYVLAAVTFCRLLELYAKGFIFDAKNVLLIRRLGILANFYGVIRAFQPVFENQGIELVNLSFALLFSPWIMLGSMTIIIAWVMDEGRKIKEEQTLTV